MGSIKNKWKDDEIEFLKKNFPLMGSQYCSQNIQRTKRSCQEMAKKLNLK